MKNQKESIWSILLADSCPTPLEFMIFYHRNKRLFFDHHGYDMLLERGVNGESILCAAFLYKHITLMKFMLGLDEYADLPEVVHDYTTQLSKFPRLHQIVNMQYEGPTYHGEHVAHICAVVFTDAPDGSTPEDESATYWMDALIHKGGADVTLPRAQGTFFSQNDLYLGETVLSFAACMGNYKLVRYLVNDIGVDPNQKDSYGNNVLHVLCYWGLYEDGMMNHLGADGPAKTSSSILEEGRIKKKNLTILDDSIFGFLCSKENRYSFKGKDLNSTEALEAANNASEEEIHAARTTADDLAKNDQHGDTPLLVAVRRGNVDMVQAYLDYKRQVMWQFGPIELARYSVSEIDTYIDVDTMNHKVGALTLAVRLNHIPIINLPVFRKLLDSKWILYAKFYFWRDFLLHITHMILFTVMIALLPNGQQYYNPSSPPPSRIPNISTMTVRDSVRTVVELLLVVINVSTVAVDSLQFSYVKKNFIVGFGASENITHLFRVALFFVGVICRLAGAWRAENIIWGVFALAGWFQVFFYTRGFEKLGPLIIVLFRIVKKDVPKFVNLAILFVLAFGEAMWLQMAPFGDQQYQILNGNLPNSTISASIGGSEWSSLPGGIWWTLRNFLIMGSSSYGDFRNSPVHVIGIAIFLVFTFVANILLINVFIAMVGSTFGSVTANAKSEWLLSRAHLIMQYDERILSEYYKQVNALKKNGGDPKLLGAPITRIGVPRPGGRIEDQLENGKMKDVHHTACYYELLMEVEKRNNELLIKRVIATTDPNSPLHEFNRFKRIKTTQTRDSVKLRSRRG
ncbi:UNVERIFIED_CONTAM: hypothetical protein HDU68_005155 [Siphonaria sp. JEL0065]|nr:hypothetical protein HDU68_005155 [Siphonaria sp. JEL0065]